MIINLREKPDLTFTLIDHTGIELGNFGCHFPQFIKTNNKLTMLVSKICNFQASKCNKSVLLRAS
jgi:hypothetical protein